MFSASLLSMMLRYDDEPPTESSFANQAELVAFLRRLRVTDGTLPIVLRTDDPMPLARILDPGFQLERAESPGGMFAWGHVPVAALVSFLAERFDVPFRRELVDLGTPLRPAAPASQSALDDCATLLGQSQKAQPTVAVAIVDRGETGTHAETFAGRVTQVAASGVGMSDHAANVLWVLLDRLNRLGILPECDIYCALVAPPANAIGPACFQHANAPEMLTALRDLAYATAHISVPLVVNLSLGTHVGPHNGQSPVEAYVNAMTSGSPPRFLCCAAGNDGGAGIAAALEISANVPDFLKVQTGPHCGNELLIEFWWEQRTGHALSVAAQVKDVAAGAPAWFTPPLTIDPTRIAMTHIPWKKTGPQFASLVHSRAHGNMSCIAFALTCKSGGLPQIEITFTFRGAADLLVRGWVVVGADPGTRFVEASKKATLVVPSTDPGVLCVSGIDGQGDAWQDSARGPAGQYHAGPAGGAPHVAYRVELGRAADSGTSFASPRACADAADIVRDPAKLSALTTPDQLALALLGATTPVPWNERTGMGGVNP